VGEKRNRDPGWLSLIYNQFQTPLMESHSQIRLIFFLLYHDHPFGLYFLILPVCGRLAMSNCRSVRCYWLCISPVSRLFSSALSGRASESSGTMIIALSLRAFVVPLMASLSGSRVNFACHCPPWILRTARTHCTMQPAVATPTIEPNRN
jgi:hypothetical protein